MLFEKSIQHVKGSIYSTPESCVYLFMGLLCVMSLGFCREDGFRDRLELSHLIDSKWGQSL